MTRPQPLPAARLSAGAALHVFCCVGLSALLASTIDAAQTTPGKAFGRGQPKATTTELTEAQFVEATHSLTTDATHDEWPALAVGPDDRVAVAWVAFDNQSDRLLVAQVQVDETGASAPAVREPIAGPGAFVMPALAFDGSGRLWAVWCARVGEQFDLFARARDASGWGRPLRLTNDAGPDSSPCLTTDQDGRVWLAWQAYRDRSLDILLARLTDAGLEETQPVTSHAADDWSPALSAGPDGALHVVWDTYRNHSYDVYLRMLRGGAWSAETPVAATPRREAHPSLAVDEAGVVWVAYDVGEESWGKHVRLHDERRIELRCVANGQVGEPAQPWQPTFTRRQPPKEEWPHLTFDSSGRLWMCFMRFATQPPPKSVGKAAKPPKGKGLFLHYATSFDGQQWTEPVVFEASSGRTNDRLRLVTLSSGRPFAVWDSDERRLPYDEISLLGNLHCGLLSAQGRASVGPFRAVNLRQPEVQSADADPLDARPRQTKIDLGDSEYVLLFGDTHRHTDLSRCNYRGDGTLTDAYRYALDLGGLDFLSVSDHDQDLNGWRLEEPRPKYPRVLWWRSEKLADLHTLPGRFLALYGYERGRTTGDGGGHKNVIYARRGLPVLSMNPQEKFFPALKGTGAVVIPHQLADGPDATDWSKWNAEYERVAEIYQARGSYEGVEGGRKARRWTTGHSLAEAYAAGARPGIIASSDHGLTHGAYAGVYATEFSRQAIVKALRDRRTFGATELIELKATLNGSPMGGEIDLNRAPSIETSVHSYEPLGRVEVLRGNAVVYSKPCQGLTAAVTFTDPTFSAGSEGYYYVRVFTEAEALAWASPWWVRRTQ